MKKVHIAIIAAVGRNDVIGNQGRVPWDIPEDRKHFASLTTGHTVVMGRKSWESLPTRFRPLPGRKNIVLTTSQTYEATGAIVCHSWEETLELIRREKKKVFVIGGEEIYRKALPYTLSLHLTLVETQPEGDTHFPTLDEEEWRLANLANVGQSETGIKFSHQLYKRVSVKGDFVNLPNSRSDDQTRLMEKIRRAEVCPFCPEHILTYHEKPILRDGTWWMVTENRLAYEGAKLHLLLVYKKHARMLYEASREAHKELVSHIKWVMETRELSGATLLWRFGETHLTGGSVDHLHAHLVAGTGDPNQKIRARIG